MYALCARYSPFDGPDDSPDAILRRNLTSTIEFPEHIFGRFSHELIELLKGLISANPKHRLTAVEALNIGIFGGRRIECDYRHTTYDSSEEFTLDSPLEGTNKNLVEEQVQKLGVTKLNNSLGINSKVIFEERRIGIDRKRPSLSLYKKSLMKAVQNTMHRASSIDRSVENSPVQSNNDSERASHEIAQSEYSSPKCIVSQVSIFHRPPLMRKRKEIC